MIGDFNARTSNRSDYVTDLLGIESTEEFVRNSNTSILDEIGTKNRNNNDTIVNPYGSKLLSLCKGLSLRILNGRTLGDTSGAYTCFQYNGKSVVDYIIADENIMHKIPILTVSPPTHLSDHAPISFCIRHGRVHESTSKNMDKCNEKLTFKWTDDSSTLFKAALELPTIKNRLHKIIPSELLSKQTEVDYLSKNITDVMIDAAKISLKTMRKIKTSRISNKLGFDKDCKFLKNKTLQLGKLVNKFPGDPVIYGKFLSSKKQF